MTITFTTTVTIGNTKEVKSFKTETTRFDVIARYEWLFPLLGTTFEKVNADIIAEEVNALNAADYATDEAYAEAFEDAWSLANNDGYELNVCLQKLLKAQPWVTIVDCN